jgi:hypothetical protein
MQQADFTKKAVKNNARYCQMPKLTIKKATENAGKSDNRQIFARLLAKQAVENIPQN